MIESARFKLNHFISVATLVGAAPTVTKDEPRPVQVPSDIATVSMVSQGNEVAS